jgi:hypothetical protein
LNSAILPVFSVDIYPLLKNKDFIAFNIANQIPELFESGHIITGQQRIPR